MIDSYTEQVNEIINSSFFEPINIILKECCNKEEYFNHIQLLRGELYKYVINSQHKNEGYKDKRIDHLKTQYKNTITQFMKLIDENCIFEITEYPTNEIQKDVSGVNYFCNKLLQELESDKYFYLTKLYQKKQPYNKNNIKNFFNELKKKVPQIKALDIKEFIDTLNY